MEHRSIASEPQPELQQAKATIAALESRLGGANQHIEQLTAEAAMLRSIIDHTPDGITIKDLEGRYVFVNQAAARIVGMEVEQILGRTDASYFPPAIVAPIREADRATLESRSAQTFEFTIQLPNGLTRTHLTTKHPHLLPDGTAGGIISIMRDISERKQAEEALRQQASMLAESQRVAKIGCWERHLASNALTCSEELYRLFELPQDAFTTLDDFLAFLASNQPEDFRHKAEKAARDLRPFSFESAIMLADGTARTLEVIGQVVLDENGQPVRMFGTAQDVSERKALEDALRAQNEQLRALDQLKNSFVNSVSHELRTPIASVMGYAEFLEDRLGGPLSPEQEQYVAEIQAGAQRLRGLVDDLLDFAKLESGSYRLLVQATDVSQKVQGAIASLRPQAHEAGVSMELELPADPITMRLDPDRIHQVLTNLIGNAIKFTPRGGRITVAVASDPHQTRISVRDTGIGIAPEHLPRLFQKFYQADPGLTRERGGAGLGLSIAKALVEAHGGCLEVESMPGSGSTFWFTLPHNGAPIAASATETESPL